MGAIRDLSLGRKLYGSFGLIVLLLICVAGAGLWSASAMRSDADAVSHALDASRLETLAAGLVSGIAKVGERLIVLIDAAAMVSDLGIAEEAA